MSSSKDAASRKKKDQIHFVNARPSSESEKLNIQRMVRTHVGKWISDQTRDRSGVPELADGILHEGGNVGPTSRVTIVEENEPLSGSSSSTSVESSHSTPERSTSNDSEQSLVHSVSSSSSAQGWKQSNTTHSRARDLQAYNHNKAVSPKLQTETIDRIGRGFWDPFHTYPSHYSPEFLRLHEGYSKFRRFSVFQRATNSSMQACLFCGLFLHLILPVGQVSWPIRHGFPCH